MSLAERMQERLDHVARLDSQYEQLQAKLNDVREYGRVDPLELDLIEAKMRVSRLEVAKTKRAIELAIKTLEEK